jgi:hypothetical protein
LPFKNRNTKKNLQQPQSSRSNTLPKAVNSFFNSIKGYPSRQYFNPNPKADDMKGLTKDKAATTTSGKPKKKRPSIFSFFSRKKRTEPKHHSALDDNISHGGSELNFDDVVAPTQSTIPTPVRSKKTFRAPLPPPEDNKENLKDASALRKRLSNASGPPKISRQGSSRRSSRKSSTRRKASAQNSKTIKGEETKSYNSNDSAPNDPPPPIPPTLETCIDDDTKPPMTQLPSKRLTVIKTETIHSLKKSLEITPSMLETDIDKSLFKEKKKQQSPVSVKKEKGEKIVPEKREEEKTDEITADMVFITSSPLPQPSSKSSPKQTKAKKEEKDPEIPPAIPQSAPPDPGAVATALSFASTTKHQPSSAASPVKRLSNFGLSPAKVPPIPVSPFEDLTDSSSESGNSTNITMPVYTNGDLKHQLHYEHKKLLNLYEEWEMLRRPQYPSPNDGHSFANLMVKQEAVLRQHTIVTSLYNQLLAPVVSNNSSPASTIRSKPVPTRHIINLNNSNPPTISRGTTPSLFKSRSTFDVNGENNNVKKGPERNYQQIGNFSPRISQTKRYSAGDILNPLRPRLGSTELQENSSNHQHQRYDERKKYVVEQKPVIRNVPIMASLPKLTNGNNVNVIITESKRNPIQPRNYNTYSPPVTKRELTPVNEKPSKPIEAKKENIEIKKPPFSNINIVPKSPSPLVESKVTKYPSPSNYSPRLNHHQNYYANSPPTTKRQVISNGFHNTNHSPPIRQISLPEAIQKPPTPIQNKKVMATKSPSKPQSPMNNVHDDLISSISSFPNVTLRNVPKPVEKSFNLGRVLENGERSSSHYREPEAEISSKPMTTKSPLSGAPPPPPPPPPPPAPLKKASNKQASPPAAMDSDTLRGDMLAEIRKAGGIHFLRSVSSK